MTFTSKSSSDYIGLVRLTGLEPALLTELEPKSNVYANFTTGAYLVLLRFLLAESKQGDKCTDVSARLLRCPKLFVRSRSHNFDRCAFAHFAVSAAGSAQSQSCQFRHTRIFNFTLDFYLPRAYRE